MLDVVIVELRAFDDRCVPAQSVNLGPPCQSGGYPLPIHVPRDRDAELIGEVRALRPWPDEGHLSTEHVDELRQLVDTGPAEEATHRRHSSVGIRRPGGVALVVLVEGPKLQQLEDLPSLTDSRLSEQDRSAAR